MSFYAATGSTDVNLDSVLEDIPAAPPGPRFGDWKHGAMIEERAVC